MDQRRDVGGRAGVGDEWSQQVVAVLYVESTVSHPGSSQRRPASARERAALPLVGPYNTFGVLVLLIQFLP